MSDPASVIGLLSGGDIDIVDFKPPIMVFDFEVPLTYMVWPAPEVAIQLTFGASAVSPFIRPISHACYCVSDPLFNACSFLNSRICNGNTIKFDLLCFFCLSSMI